SSGPRPTTGPWSGPAAWSWSPATWSAWATTRSTSASRWGSSSRARSRRWSPPRRSGPGSRTTSTTRERSTTVRISALIEIGAGLLMLGGVVAFLATRAPARRVAALRRTVRRLAATTLPSWRWAEPDNLAGLTNELSAMTTRLQDRLEGVTEERDGARPGESVHALDDGVLLLDGRGRLLLANPAARSWFGLAGDLRPGLPAKRVLGVPQITALAEQATQAGAPVVGTCTLVFPEPRTLAVRAFSLADRGPTGRIVVTMTDITQRRRLEVLRRDFVANASHELKTPVAAVRALAETLQTALPDDPEAGHRFAERIGREAERLEALVRDLLDPSRVARGLLD